MNTKLLKLTLNFLFISLAVQINLTTLQAQQNLPNDERMSIIDREMHCIQEKINKQEDLQWSDVCYTNNLNAQTENDKNAYQQNVSTHIEESIQLAQATGTALIFTEEDIDTIPMADFSQKENIIEIGFEGSKFDYEEPGLMTDKGNMYGIFINYTHRSRKNKQINHIKQIFHDTQKINVYKLEGKFSGGELDYDSQGTGSSTGARNYIFEVRGMVGYDLNFSDRTRFTPYMGVGYRYLKDDGGGETTTTGHWSYDREANYFYAPIGVEAHRVLTPGWILDVVLEYNWFISGKQKSHLGDVSTSYETLTNDQSRGYGLRGSFKITKEMEGMNFFIEPFFRYWNIEDSEVSPVVYSGVVVGAGLEPENNSTECGVKFGVQF